LHLQAIAQICALRVNLTRAMRKIIFGILVIIPAIGCWNNSKLPKEKYYQFNFPAKYTYHNDTLKVEITNPLNCPLRISISSPDKSLIDMAAKFGTLTLKEKSDTVIKYYLKSEKEIRLQFNSVLGDPDKAIKNEKFSLPFPKNRVYKIIQGYNGGHSHNTNYARYAIDFSLNINDTVCSAADGYVVGVIKDYVLGGKTEDWLDYSNYITIYHPQSGLFTQYVHLVKNGAFVKVGDAVTKGQPIGLSGMTGYTTVAHLHFNVLKPDKKEGLLSTGISFEEGYNGTALTENATVKK
jgi:murein DD-endopeptidase MepM/ murein hydrolase activator NlpD